MFRDKLACIDVFSECFEGLFSVCTSMWDGLLDRGTWSGLSGSATRSDDKIFELAANLLAQGEYFGKFIAILSAPTDRDDRPNFFNGLQIGFFFFNCFASLYESEFSIESFFSCSLHLSRFLFVLVHVQLQGNFFVSSVVFVCVISGFLNFVMLSTIEILL